jgi:putative ABC transport system ATP-binding protein
MQPSLLVLEKINKTYFLGKSRIPALKDLSFHLNSGDFTAVMGPSGSGKSTLLNIIGCLDRASSGNYHFEEEDISLSSDEHLSEIRSRKIGFIFQQFNLIQHFNVIENVLMPFLYSSTTPDEAIKQSKEAIAMVGLSHRLQHKSFELSGGEMQRVAIARAIAGKPKLILADEPTGNLDSKTGELIMDIISQLNKLGTSVILVTHDRQVASQAHTVFTMKDGYFV